LRRTGPHHSRRGHLNTSFYIDAHTRVLHCALPQEPWFVARLVTYLPLRNSMLSLTPGGRSALVHYRTFRIACAHDDGIGSLPK